MNQNISSMSHFVSPVSHFISITSHHISHVSKYIPPRWANLLFESQYDPYEPTRLLINSKQLKLEPLHLSFEPPHLSFEPPHLSFEPLHVSFEPPHLSNKLKHLALWLTTYRIWATIHTLPVHCTVFNTVHPPFEPPHLLYLSIYPYPAHPHLNIFSRPARLQTDSKTYRAPVRKQPQGYSAALPAKRKLK